MESSTNSSNWNWKNNRQQGPLDAIIAGCLIGLIEGTLLTLVIRSSWRSYVQSHWGARRTLCDFLQKVSFMRKVSYLIRFVYVFSFLLVTINTSPFLFQLDFKQGFRCCAQIFIHNTKTFSNDFHIKLNCIVRDVFLFTGHGRLG